jgi:hypothetical protein
MVESITRPHHSVGLDLFLDLGYIFEGMEQIVNVLISTATWWSIPEMRITY